MALFIVLILVLVMTVVISQLSFTTKIEERISASRLGFTELSYSLQASARGALLALHEDYALDIGTEAEAEDQMDDLAQSGGGTAGGGNQGGGPGGGGASGGGGAGAEDDSSPVDPRHDDWAYPITDSLNNTETDCRIIDGESCFDLNFLFEYVRVPEEEEEDGLLGEEDEDLDEDPEDNTSAEPDEEDLLLEEDEWMSPSPERVEATEAMLAMLIEAIVDYNNEFGFDYEDIPDPDVAARAISTFVLDRQMEEETRQIRSIGILRDVPEISWELFNGPHDPAELEGDEEDLFETLFNELSPISSDALAAAGFEVFEDGVESIPRPLGLRHVMTSHSTGKINLNTARPEVYIALMQSFEDYDEAKDVARQIEAWLNTYSSGGDEADQSDEGIFSEDDPEAPQVVEFNSFRAIQELGNVNEEWVEDASQDESVFALLKLDLERVAVFKSSFFTANIKGTREDRQLSGRMVVARKDRKVLVLYWQEVPY